MKPPATPHPQAGPAAAPAPSRVVVMGWAAAVMAVIGLIGPSFGPALIPARAAFHLSILTAGALFLVFGAARTVGAFLSGALSDLAGRRTLLVGYGGTLLLGLAAVAVAPDWPAVLGGAAGIGLAFGAVSTEANAVTALASGPSRGADLSFINAIYSIGAALGPLTVGVLLEAQAGWRLAFALWAAATVVPFWGLAAAAGRLPRTVMPRAGASLGPRDPRVLLLAGMAFIYNGIGWTVGGWAATYLVDHFGAGLLTGTLGSSVFYALLAAGRFTNGFLAARTPAPRLLRWGAAASAAALLCLALAPNALMALAGFGAAGFCLAGIYPNLVTFATERRPDRPGAMAGVISTGGAIGVSVVPFAAGALSRGLGLLAMPWLMMGLGCALVILAALAARPEAGIAPAP